MSDLTLDEAVARHVRLAGMATEEQLAAARKMASAEAIPLGEAFVRQGVITPTQRDTVEKKLEAQREHAHELGGFKIQRKLGEGGMGAVYLALEPGSRRRVALKVLPKRNAQDPEFVQRFRREAEAATRLDHPNIVRATSAGEDKGYHFIVMECCEGEPLKKRIERTGFLPHAEAAEIAVQVARGLECAHAAGFIHRDIKPENIMITPQGTARILDLGLAKNLADTDDSLRTATGAALGTPHYISPEQARGDKGVDGRTDLYSLGATLYHAMTGRTPFSGTSIFEVIQKHLMEQLPDPRDIRPEIPERIVHVVRRLMAKSPNDRYRGAAELLVDLERVRARKAPLARALDPALSSIAKPTGLAAPPRKGRNLLIAGAGAAALAALAILAWPSPEPPPKPPLAEAPRKKPPSPPPPEPPKPFPVEEKPKVEEPKPAPPPAKVEDPKPLPPGHAARPPEPPPEPVKPPEPSPSKPPEPAPPAKTAVPDDTQQREATAALQKRFAPDYAKTSNSDRLALARRLLDLEPGDAAANYVRLREARDLAARGGDVAGAFSTIDRMAEAFVVDTLPARADAILLAAAAARTRDGLAAAAQRALEAMKEAIAEDRFEIAIRLDAPSQKAASDAKNPELAAEIKAAGKEASDLLKDFTPAVRAARKTLETKPDDAAANLAMGRFTLFSKGDWEKALPMLSRGDDAPLRALAEKELRPTLDPETRIDLCNGWLSLAQRETIRLRKLALNERARMWFEQIKGDLKDSQRKDLEKALGPAPAAPAASRPKPAVAPAKLVRRADGTIDLMPFVDPARDAVLGAWTKNAQGLVSPAGGTNFGQGSARIWIPYSPPAEYELILNVERVQGMEDLVIGMVFNGRPIAAALDGWGAQTGAGVHTAAGWTKIVSTRALTNNKSTRVVCFVRKGGFAMTVDARTFLGYKEIDQMSSPAAAQAPGKPEGLILGTIRSVYHITAISIKPIGPDDGRLLR